MFGGQIYALAPSEDEVRAKLASVGGEVEKLATAKEIARQWREMLNQVLR